MNAIAPKWRPLARQNMETGMPGNTTVTAEDQPNSVVVNTSRETTDLRESIRIFTDRGNLLEATALLAAEDQ